MASQCKFQAATRLYICITHNNIKGKLLLLIYCKKTIVQVGERQLERCWSVEPPYATQLVQGLTKGWQHVAPENNEKVPFGQGLQQNCLNLSLKVPMGQGTHLPFWNCVPGGQGTHLPFTGMLTGRHLMQQLLRSLKTNPGAQFKQMLYRARKLCSLKAGPKLMARSN